jgi:protein-S-isoprenylcysteine O-methyltransferase Ste14
VTRSASYLRPVGRLFWLAVNVGIGGLPSAAFFVWVERSCSLPRLPIEWGWPWIDWLGASLAWRALWDAALILAFGLVHSALAQPVAHRVLARVVPPQAMRSFYLAVTGGSLIGVMGLWQSTGVVLWALPTSPRILSALSVVIYWGILLCSLRAMSVFDALEFLGLRQIYRRSDRVERSEGNPRLVREGIYGRVRHPIYLFTLAAFALAPMMTLDRAIVVLASLAYLAVGIPLEERKLRRLFGPAYDDYRAQVPALLPRLRARAPSPAGS